MAAVCDSDFELRDHPTYSPDLFSVSQHKKHLTGKQYRTNEIIILSGVEDFFEEQDESFYATGIQALQH